MAVAVNSLVDPEIYKVFAFWAGVIALKMVLMSPMTGMQRFRKKVFPAEEDVRSMGGKKSGAKVAYDDPDVERVRRAHRNDMENILPWFAITWLYLGTNPSFWLASILIKAFVFSRIAHTFVYAIVPLPQPSRAIAFFVAFGVNVYQSLMVIMHYL